MSKQYGLILPKKTLKDHPILPISKSHSIFNEDSDSDTPTISKPSGSQAIKRQDKLNQQKAVEEDPTVFQYDEIYDEMEQQKKESKLAKKGQDKKPKYINKLLAAAEKRKRENERRIERQVQKEREEEGDMFKDKESFITSAYKKKLEEMKKLEEEEKREAYLESIGDVTKQGNLDGFYRHLYEQKVKYEDDKEHPVKQDIKEEPKTDSENEATKSATEENCPKIGEPSQRNVETKIESSYSDSSQNEQRNKRSRSPTTHRDVQRGEKKNKLRNYRTRKESDEESDKNEDNNIKMEHLPSNIDADSDFSIDSSDSEDEVKPTLEKNDRNEKLTEATIETAPAENDVTNTKSSEIENKVTKNELPKINKPKIDIWKKRTVGEKFDEAVRRYFERKANREMGL